MRVNRMFVGRLGPRPAAIAKIYNPDDYEELKLVEVPAKGEDDDDADEDDVDAAQSNPQWPGRGETERRLSMGWKGGPLLSQQVETPNSQPPKYVPQIWFLK